MIFITIFMITFAVANSLINANGMPCFSFFQKELPVAFAFVFTFHDVNVTVSEVAASLGVESDIILSTIHRSIPPSAVEVSSCKKHKSNSDGDCENDSLSSLQFKRKRNHQNDMERATAAKQNSSDRKTRDIDIGKTIPDMKEAHLLAIESRRQAQKNRREQKIKSHRRKIIHGTKTTSKNIHSENGKMNKKQHHEIQDASDIVRNHLQIQRVSKREQKVNARRGII
eukprot:CAMPEP_0195286396 /NCGR_PEP_ID=MMETSP0707-20130614/3874_1 /TAXON_ID=33640 /ORGANISM="Asterionellopsis glacialis, Strain CCMP134" /LENGTH=226 /DNA_ID=CAMNT_0040346031 /DNA_START=15 /DNA_END=695 /DNA_ORIENTATION=-